MDEKLKQVEEAIQFLGNSIAFSIESDGNGYGLLVLSHWDWRTDNITRVEISNRNIGSYTDGFLQAVQEMRQKLGFTE